MWTQIAEEQAQLQAMTRISPGWTAGKKRTLNRSSGLPEERPGSRSCVVWLATLSSCATKALSPPLRLLACWLNVRHQMIADQHDRALKVIFSRIREHKEILGNSKIEGTTAR